MVLKQLSSISFKRKLLVKFSSGVYDGLLTSWDMKLFIKGKINVDILIIFLNHLYIFSLVMGGRAKALPGQPGQKPG